MPTLWGSFEIRNQRLAKIMLQQFAKEPMHLKLDQFDKFADKFEKLPLYFLTFHGSQPLNMVMDVSNLLIIYLLQFDKAIFYYIKKCISHKL